VKPWDEGLAAGSEIHSVLVGEGHLKWAVGYVYAVRPGRGQKAVGRIRITNIRREHVQDISEADAIAEGMTDTYFDGLPSYKNRVIPGHLCRAAFADTWTTIHTKPGTRWEDDPEVWVLEFELVRET